MVKDGLHISLDRDIVGCSVHLRITDVLVLGGYARHGEFQEPAAAVARIMRNGAIPFLWLADFNASPSELDQPEFLDPLNACVLRPGADATCHVGVFYQAIVTHKFQQQLLPTTLVGHQGSVGELLGDGVSGQPTRRPNLRSESMAMLPKHLELACVTPVLVIGGLWINMDAAQVGCIVT